MQRGDGGHRMLKMELPDTRRSTEEDLQKGGVTEDGARVEMRQC